MEEFKYLGVLFTNVGKIEREIDRRIGAASALKRALDRSVVVKIYRYVPTHIYGQVNILLLATFQHDGFGGWIWPGERCPCRKTPTSAG